MRSRPYRLSTLLKLALSIAWCLVQPSVLAADKQGKGLGPGSTEKLRQEIIAQTKTRTSPVLSQYCRDACSIIDVKVDIEEAVLDSDDLGFESVVGDDLNASLYVDKIILEIQVDDRVTSVNRDRLLSILRNHLANLGSSVEIIWRPVTMPQIGQGAAMEEQLKRSIAQKVATAIDKVIDTYCPEQCLLSQVAVDGKLVTQDEAQGVAALELVRDKSGSSILRIENIDIEVAMDADLSAETRKKISNIMKAKTRFAAPINFDIQVSSFPVSWAKKKEDDEKKSDDPFGLNKLRETLKIFKELAGTKEVITSSNSREESSQKRESSSASSMENRDRLEAAGGREFKPLEWVLMIGGLLAGLGVILTLVMRYSAASRDARIMMAAIKPEAAAAAPAAASGEEGQAAQQDQPGRPALTGAIDARKELTSRLRSNDLKDELIATFLDQPRVAKETFSRLLQDEGIEQTAKFVHLFGHLVIFELLGDPNLQRDLYELSEFYHKSDFNFKPDEELKLLNQLKTRVTANEIRVLARRQTDKFDFLSRLDPTQIYNLVVEEKPQIQSIVMTQLDHKRRRAIFDMYQGQAKVELMRELCRADAIPKEYLANVAKALQKKVSARPEFDTENLRSHDVLLELMEKAGLDEQRELMRNLTETNPEAARGIKLKLVTVEIMPYLRDGHLLEIVLGMDRDDLMTFLSGTREHIRSLLLTKAPEELAESWLEDLANVKGIDDQNYRLVEMKILNRIRALAHNGAINLLDINEMILQKPSSAKGGEGAEMTGVESPSSMVA